MTEIHFFLGIGQGKRARRWLTKRVPEVMFHEAPDYLSAQSESEMIDQATRYAEEQVGDSQQYVLVAESQAGPVVIEAVYRQRISQPKQLVLIQPLGLNPDTLGATATERMTTALGRGREFWRDPQQTLRIPGNRWTVEYLAWSSLRNARRFKGRWADGSNTDSRQKLAAIAETVPVSVYASSDDVFFPYHEVIADFPRPDLVHEIPGGHLNRATEHGIRQLEMILHKTNIL